MICKQCGNEININDKVCPVCGTLIDIQTMLVDDEALSEQNPYAEPQPIQAQPIQAQPIQAQPIQPQPVQAQPIQPQPIQAQPVQAQPVQPAPMRPQYESSQPIQPQYAQPVQPQYVQPQPVQPQYVQPQPVQPQYAQPQYGQPAQPPVTPESQSLAKRILGFGIAAIACAWFPITSILGIIFGAIAKGRAKTYDAMNYPSNGMRVTGKILGLIGFIAGIIMTVYYTIYFIAILSVL